MYRNLSALGNNGMCDDLVKEDIMTPLSAMLRDCLSRLELSLEREEDERVKEGVSLEGETGESPEESVKGKKAKHRKRLKADIEKQQLTQVLEQGLHLLWNVRCMGSYTTKYRRTYM